MGLLKNEDVFKTEVLSPAEYAKKYGNGIQKEAVYYAIANNHVDYIVLGKRNFIVMTAHTRLYKPNANPHRVKLRKKKHISATS